MNFLKNNYHKLISNYNFLKQSKCHKVFIIDGAVWIGNWISRSYENSTQILDLFHVTEKLDIITVSIEFYTRPFTFSNLSVPKLYNDIFILYGQRDHRI